MSVPPLPPLPVESTSQNIPIVNLSLPCDKVRIVSLPRLLLKASDNGKFKTYVRFPLVCLSISGALYPTVVNNCIWVIADASFKLIFPLPSFETISFKAASYNTTRKSIGLSLPRKSQDGLFNAPMKFSCDNSIVICESLSRIADTSEAFWISKK